MSISQVTSLVVNDTERGHAKMLIGGRKCYLASIRSTGLADGDSEASIQAQYQRAIDRKHPTTWINLSSLVLCGDAGFYDREAARWAEAFQLEVGDLIEFEGATYKIGTAPNKNFSLIPA